MASHQRPYADRRVAGEVLADAVVRSLDDHHAAASKPLVLALPRGGVPVSLPVAQRLGVPPAVLVVRKLGAPGHPELAVGAIAAVGDHVEQVLNSEGVSGLGMTPARLAEIIEDETAELWARVARFGATPPVRDRPVIVVDDGLATGATMRAAVAAVRSAGAAFVVVAVPVGAVAACRDLSQTADLVVCPRRPDPFRAVGEHYRDFHQLADAEVLALLKRSA
ncbi:MAG: phosphoribosyltransferase [Microlunatus sp.]|nr:phosphoribosyltransferase [Microlunatus sp.]